MVNKRNKDDPFNKSYFLNTETNQILDMSDEEISMLVWSPTGEYIAHSNLADDRTDFSRISAKIFNLKSKQSFNVTDIVRSALQKGC